MTARPISVDHATRCQQRGAFPAFARCCTRPRSSLMLLTERSAVRYDAERRDRRCRSWAYRKAFLFIARSSDSLLLFPLPSLARSHRKVVANQKLQLCVGFRTLLPLLAAAQGPYVAREGPVLVDCIDPWLPKRPPRPRQRPSRLQSILRRAVPSAVTLRVRAAPLQIVALARQ